MTTSEDVKLVSDDGTEGHSYKGHAWAKEESLRTLLKITAAMAKNAAQGTDVEKEIKKLITAQSKFEKDQKSDADGKENAPKKKERRLAAAQDKRFNKLALSIDKVFGKLADALSKRAERTETWLKSLSMRDQGEEDRSGWRVKGRKALEMVFGGIAKAGGLLISSLSAAYYTIWETTRWFVNNFTKIVGAFFTVFMSVSGAVIGKMQEWWKTWKMLNEHGMYFSSTMSEGAGSMQAMADQARKANLTIADMGELISAALRPALQIGTEAVAQLSRRVRENSREFGQFGLTINEMNSFLGDYLEGQRIAGVLEHMTHMEREKRSSEYIKTLHAMTQVTAKTRDEITANMRQARENAMLQGFLHSKDAETRKMLQQNFESLNVVFSSVAQGPEIMESLIHGMARGSVATGAFANHLLKAGRSTEVQMLQNLANDTKYRRISADEARNRAFDILQSLKDNLGGSIEHLTVAEDESGAYLGNLVAELQGINLGRTKQEMDESLQLFGNWSQTMTEVRNIMDDFVSGILGNKSVRDALFGHNGLFKTLSKGLKDVAEQVGDGAESIGGAVGGVLVAMTRWIGKIFSADNMKKIESFFKSLIKIIGDFGNKISEVGLLEALVPVVAEGFKLIFKGMWEAAKFIWNDVLGWFGKLAIVIGVAAVTFGALIPVTKGVIATFKLLGKGIGLLTKGVMAAWNYFKKPPVVNRAASLGGGLPGQTTTAAKPVAKAGAGKGLFGMAGIAAGLKMFANPMVLAGGLAIGAVIVAIGGAIAGATWLVGKALPTFIEGFSGFADIDGAALKSTAAGMAALSVSLGMFGVGSAVGSIGSFYSSLADGLGKLFGMDTPFEKIEKFANLNIDSEKLKAKAVAIKSMVEAISGLDAARAAESERNAQAIERNVQVIERLNQALIDNSKLNGEVKGLDAAQDIRMPEKTMNRTSEESIASLVRAIRDGNALLKEIRENTS